MCVEGIPVTRDVRVKNKQTLVYARNRTLLFICACEQALHFVAYCFCACGNYWRDELFFSLAVMGENIHGQSSFFSYDFKKIN